MGPLAQQNTAVGGNAPDRQMLRVANWSVNKEDEYSG